MAHITRVLKKKCVKNFPQSIFGEIIVILFFFFLKKVGYKDKAWI